VWSLLRVLNVVDGSFKSPGKPGRIPNALRFRGLLGNHHNLEKQGWPVLAWCHD
jgi:hypothetical protein